MSEYFHYISMADYNFNISLLKYPEAIETYEDIDRHFKELHAHLYALPDLTSKDATYVIGLLMLISHRQMRNSFYLFLRRMSYDAMLLFRVGLESAVFAFRIFKEPRLANVWASKNENWKEFSENFRWKEFPNDIPYKEQTKEILDSLNSYWSHPNIDYFSSSALFPDKVQKDEKKEIKLHYFDHNELSFMLYITWFLDKRLLLLFQKLAIIY